MTQDLYQRLQCPICFAAFHKDGQSLVCRNGHCFDIAAKGYINFLGGKAAGKYTRALFESRRRIMARGFFAQVVDACAGAAALYQQNPSPLVVDAGCGEGHYARALHGRLNARVIGVDIAKEAIAVAARGRQDGVLWLAADMAHMPIKAASADVMLNIFAPANYKEFKRVLKPGGILIKAAPGKAHLAQLRQRLNLPRDEEDLALIAGQMKKHCKFITRQSCARTMPLNKSELADMSGMTPLLFNRGGGEVMFDDIDEITIDAELFVAHMLLPT